MKKIRKLAILTMAVLMVATVFAACGSAGDSGEAVAEPYEGKYIPVAATAMGVTLGAEEFEGWSLEIGAGGKGSMTAEGETAKLTYTVEGDTMTMTVEDEEMVATIGEDTLVVEDLMETGMGITFAKEGSAAAEELLNSTTELDELELEEEPEEEAAEEAAE